MTVLKAYRNQTNLTGQIFEVVPAAGVTFYAVQLDSPVNGRSWPANIPVAPGTTSLKFFVDPTFAGDVWSISTALRGDEISIYPSTDTGTRLAFFDLPATGGGGTDTTGGVQEAPADGQLYGRKSAAWAVVPPPGSGPQGIPGVKGDQGLQGIQGIQGPPGTGSGGGLPGYLNVMDYGATGGADDTVALNAAANACRAFGGENARPGLYFPPGHTFTISSTLDLTGIRMVRCEAWLNVDYTPLTGPAIISRAASGDAGGSIYFHGINSNDVYGDLKQPILLLQGFHASTIRVDFCQYVRIEANRADSTYSSFAYNEIHYGIVYRHEIGDSAATVPGGWGWVNENIFVGGDAAHVRIGGYWRTNTGLAQSPANMVRVTCPSHGFVTGNMVELYGTHQYVSPSNTVVGLVTVVDANTYDFVDCPWQSPPQGGYGQSMGPPTYGHNHNIFDLVDLEADVNLILNDVTSNRFRDGRFEAEWGSIVAFGPNALGNTVEVSSMAQHGNLPDVGQAFEFHCTVKNYAPNRNWVGWFTPPKPWGT